MTKAELLHVADETKLRREALYEEGECGSILDCIGSFFFGEQRCYGGIVDVPKRCFALRGVECLYIMRMGYFHALQGVDQGIGGKADLDLTFRYDEASTASVAIVGDIYIGGTEYHVIAAVRDMQQAG